MTSIVYHCAHRDTAECLDEQGTPYTYCFDCGQRLYHADDCDAGPSTNPHEDEEGREQYGDVPD